MEELDRRLGGRAKRRLTFNSPATGLEDPTCRTPCQEIRPMKNARVSGTPFTFGINAPANCFVHNTPQFGRILPKPADSRLSHRIKGGRRSQQTPATPSIMSLMHHSPPMHLPTSFQAPSSGAATPALYENLFGYRPEPAFLGAHTQLSQSMRSTSSSKSHLDRQTPFSLLAQSSNSDGTPASAPFLELAGWSQGCLSTQASVMSHGGHPAVAPGAFGSPALEAEQPNPQQAHAEGATDTSTLPLPSEGANDYLSDGGNFPHRVGGSALQTATDHHTSNQQLLQFSGAANQQALQPAGHAADSARSTQSAPECLQQTNSFKGFPPVAESGPQLIGPDLAQTMTAAWEAPSGSSGACMPLWQQHQATAQARPSNSGAAGEMKSHPIGTHQLRNPRGYDSDSEAEEPELAMPGSDKMLQSPADSCMQQRLWTEAGGIVRVAEHVGMSSDISHLTEALDHRFEALMLSPDHQVPLLHNRLGRKLSMHGLDGTGGTERWGPLALFASRNPSTCGHRSTATSASGDCALRDSDCLSCGIGTLSLKNARHEACNLHGAGSGLSAGGPGHLEPVTPATNASEDRVLQTIGAPLELSSKVSIFSRSNSSSPVKSRPRFGRADLLEPSPSIHPAQGLVQHETSTSSLDEAAPSDRKGPLDRDSQDHQ